MFGIVSTTKQLENTRTQGIRKKKKNEVNILVLILPRINVALAGFRGLVRQALPGRDLPEAGNEGGPESRRGLSGTRSGRLGSLVLAEDRGTRR